jgi:hypothetical protein
MDVTGFLFKNRASRNWFIKALPSPPGERGSVRGLTGKLFIKAD